MSDDLPLHAALYELLNRLRLPVAHAVRLYEAARPHLDPAAAEWHLHLVDRRFAAWPGCRTGRLDLHTGATVARLPNRAVESVVYDLAEMARRRAGEGTKHGDDEHAAG